MASNNSEIPVNLKQRMMESYDAIAPEYNEWTTTHSEQRMQYLGKLLGLLDEKPSSQVSVLELGCGGGLPVTQKLLDHANFHVTANDLSGVQIDVARKNLASDADRLELVQGDMTELDFPNGSFDAVIGMYSLIHLPRSEQREVMIKIAKWLKPGGYLLANFSETAMEGKVLDKWLTEKGWGYWSGYGAEETIAKAKETGLHIVLDEVAKDSVDDVSFLWLIATNGASS
ncbi:putative Methyltransferase [Seiridium cardinale]